MEKKGDEGSILASSDLEGYEMRERKASWWTQSDVAYGHVKACGAQWQQHHLPYAVF